MELRKSASELTGIVLSIVLITGISLIPTLQIAVQGQVQRQQSPPTPGTIAPPSTTPAPPTPATTRPPLDFEVVGNVVNQSTTIMIPQSSVMTMLDNLQTAMDAVADDEDAMMALESVDQELKSAANASGISIENTTDGGDVR